MAHPSLSGDTLTLELTFAFHQKRLNEPRNKEILTKVLEEVRHSPTQILPVLTAKQSADSGAAPISNSVETISNIFGGAELLES